MESNKRVVFGQIDIYQSQNKENVKWSDNNMVHKTFRVNSADVENSYPSCHSTSFVRKEEAYILKSYQFSDSMQPESLPLKFDSYGNMVSQTFNPYNQEEPAKRPEKFPNTFIDQDQMRFEFEI